MEREKLSANEIKIQNRQRIYQFIRENHQVSKQDVVVGLQLSLPTVTQNLEYCFAHLDTLIFTLWLLLKKF